jgi:mono/diheme cytochrome c family protein
MQRLDVLRWKLKVSCEILLYGQDETTNTEGKHMAIRRQWIASSLVLWGFGGVCLGGIAFAEADAVGKKTYQKMCQSCHAADGTGNNMIAKSMKISIPPVTGAALEKQDDAAMLSIIAEGKGKMPGYAKRLSAEEQQQVLEYMKTLGR